MAEDLHRDLPYAVHVLAFRIRDGQTNRQENTNLVRQMVDYDSVSVDYSDLRFANPDYVVFNLPQPMVRVLSQSQVLP